LKNETLALAQALIARKSITPADEGCQQLIVERLAPLGFVPEVMVFGDVTNLWIRHGVASPRRRSASATRSRTAGAARSPGACG
jgi:succinyl-diaminopimelate desuccinylase